jgi:hypothetical protein
MLREPDQILHAEASQQDREEYLRKLRAEAERNRVWAENSA